MMQLVHLALLGLTPCVEIEVPEATYHGSLKALDLRTALENANVSVYRSPARQQHRSHGAFAPMVAQQLSRAKPGYSFVNIAPRALHFANLPGTILTGPTFRDLSALMTLQILEHPTAKTIANVEETLRAMPRAFAGIHLRSLWGPSANFSGTSAERPASEKDP